MIQIEYLPIVLTGIGIMASILYYTNVLRNANKTQQTQLETRQAQLFMSLYETYRTPEFRQQWLEFMNLEWTDWDDFKERYRLYTGETSPELSKWQSIMSFYDGIGLLVKKGLMDISFVDEMWYRNVKWGWEKNQPIVDRFRRSVTPWEEQLRDSKQETGEEIYPRIYKNFEYLYNELMKYVDTHSKPET